MNWKIPLADIDFDTKEEEAALRVIRSRWLSMGKETQQFEEEFGAYIGTKYALAVTNATAALHMACLAIGVGPGDEVIVPSLTFVATANAVRYTGGLPIFADIEGEDRLTISPISIEKCLSERTRAVIVMHYAGYPCDMPAIHNIAKEHDLAIIEDAAHAIGSELSGRKLGAWGQIGCFSFFSNKNMTTGEGGMLTTNDDALAQKLRIIRSHGMTSLSWDRHKGHSWTYDVVDLGFNYRIDEIRSAIGRVQLNKVQEFNLRRQKLTEMYRDLLNELIPGVLVPFQNAQGLHSYHIMPVLLPEDQNRFRFMEELKTAGIQTSIHYPPVHHFKNYTGKPEFLRVDLPYTDNVGKREVTLPLYPTMSFKDVEFVVKVIQNWLYGKN